jgi:regulator of replication initiation timing
MTLPLDELERKALAIGPEEWFAHACRAGKGTDCWCGVVGTSPDPADDEMDSVIGAGACTKRVADYIAAADPQTVLALIAELKAHRATPLGAKIAELISERGQLREENASLREECKRLKEDLRSSRVTKYVAEAEHLERQLNTLRAAAQDTAKALEGLLKSKGLKEAPLYDYCESIPVAREALAKLAAVLGTSPDNKV